MLSSLRCDYYRPTRDPASIQCGKDQRRHESDGYLAGGSVFCLFSRRASVRLHLIEVAGSISELHHPYGGVE